MQELQVNAGEGGFTVGKRLGLDKDAIINSKGPVKIGSLFCKMRNLPQKEDHSPGVIINFEQSLSIDNLQGVATLKSK